MPKYSFHTKRGLEPIRSIEAADRDTAIDIFAKGKVLERNEFLDLYEVTKTDS